MAICHRAVYSLGLKAPCHSYSYCEAASLHAFLLRSGNSCWIKLATGGLHCSFQKKKKMSAVVLSWHRIASLQFQWVRAIYTGEIRSQGMDMGTTFRCSFKKSREFSGSLECISAGNSMTMRLGIISSGLFISFLSYAF